MAKTRKSTTTKKSTTHSTNAGVHKNAAPKHSSHHTAKSGATGKGRGRGKPKKSHGANGTAHALTNATNTRPPPFIVKGNTDAALFTLTAYRGEGMCLLAMNWKDGQPPDDFVGFAIEYMPPGGKSFYQLQNRIAFPSSKGQVNPNTLSSRLSPFQKFRWIHFPGSVEPPGTFIYRVTSVFMDDQKVLSYGHYQEADISLKAETYPGEINIAFTRGFISSQAFVDRFGTNGGVGTILPTSSKAGITFKPTDPKAPEALAWMGFEVREAIFNALDAAISDTSAQVRVAAYDFDDPEIVDRLEKLGDR
ncbi:hypothetical protein EJ03DRAFT_376014 [Teratosphaeria nubilosa]|uniref:Uncharacterized protein n=1 Tax=Teratosphaeria nubilosa TaxID=161662 RepID=A0A6G1L4F8_9PEZI|nr:hypothetical protein EJ03DRAFT_376014 [Teratosphaeria nubilosa]